MSYVELQVTSNFSFRRGGSHPEELVDQAADLGYEAIGMTDRNTFAGVVRAYQVAKDRNIRLIPGVRLDLLDGPSLLAYPTDKEAYARFVSTTNAR
jgi:error-prone DNA polymerase